MRTTLCTALATGALALAGPLALPSPAATATTAAAAEGRTTAFTFADDAGDWTPSATYSGLCLQGLLCPTVTAGYVATGGTEGAEDGYLATTFGSLATTMAGTSTGGWLSAPFLYAGVDGLQPTSVSLDLATKVSLSGTTAMDDSSYQVDLVDVASGAATTVVPRTPLSEDDAWAVVPAGTVSPDRLTIGHSYQVRISTTYRAAAGVMTAGEVGYDDLRLTAARTVPSSSSTFNETTTVVILPTPAAPAAAPAPASALSTRLLRQYVAKTGLPRTIKLVGHHFRFRVSCLAASAPQGCKYSLDALTSGKGSPTATTRSVVRLQPGASRVVTLGIRPKYRARYQAGRKAASVAFLRAKVRSGVFKVTVVERVRVTK